MEKVKHFSSIVEKFTKVVGMISFAAVFIMMMLNVIDVLLSKLFKTPILGTYELTQRLLMCAVFTSFATPEIIKQFRPTGGEMAPSSMDMMM